jgi:hypothetical protein
MIKETSTGYKNNKKKLLIISYPFPPIPYSGTYRIIRMCKGLAKLGVEVHALSIKVDERIPNDYDLIGQLPDAVTVHRTPIIDPWLRYQKWKKDGGSGRWPIFNKFLSGLLRLITIPDHQIFWIPFAVLHGQRIIRKHNIRKILISSPPNSSQLIGYILKKVTKVKWITDFRDPIVGNIAEVNLIRPSDFLSKIEKLLRVKFEKLIVNNADKVVLNTESHRKELLEKFKANKFHTVRNAFDEDDYKGIRKDKYDKFTISHIGSMYGLRKADVLFQAIKRLEAELSPNPLNLQVLFVGATDGRLEQSISEYGIENYVKVQPSVTHRKAIEIMMKSHLLLLVKATGKGSYGQIPAKFYEYLGTRNPILCLGPEKSEVADLINELGVGCVSENNEDKVFEYLKYFYTKYLSCEALSTGNNLIHDFTTHSMASRVKQLI